MREIIHRAELHVRSTMQEDCTGHDYFHIDRVRGIAIELCRLENRSMSEEIIELVSLLHEIGDAKLDNISENAPSVRALVLQWNGSESLADRIASAVSEIGFKGGFNSPPSSLEAQIVQDADRLDALGAIGIARAFAYGGHIGQKLLDPDVPQKTFSNEKEYRNHKGTTVNHFHEKLFRLPGLLNTPSAKRVAEERIDFMQHFLRRLGNECGIEFLGDRDVL